MRCACGGPCTQSNYADANAQRRSPLVKQTIQDRAGRRSAGSRRALARRIDWTGHKGCPVLSPNTSRTSCRFLSGNPGPPARPTTKPIATPAPADRGWSGMGRRCTAERTVMHGTDPCGIGKAARSWPPRTAAESPVLHGGRAGHCFPCPFRALVHVQGATLHYSPRSSYTGPGWPIGDVTSGLLHPDVVVVATHARTETEGTFAGPQGGTITARTRIESHLLDPAGRTSDDCAGCGHSSSLQPSRGFWTLDGLTQESDQVVRSIVYITLIHHTACIVVLYKEFNPNE